MDNNNYYNYETPYYDTPNVDKYKNITNVSQLPNYYIKQPNSNEFIIKCNNMIWGVLALLLGSSGFLSFFICDTIYDLGGETNTGGIIFGIAFSGFLTVLGILGFLCSIVRQKVILFEDYIQIKSYYILCCINSNKIYNYTDINSFQVDIIKEKNDDGVEVEKDIKIVCYNKFNEKKYFFAHNFGLEEAEYFVYVVNNFINMKKM